MQWSPWRSAGELVLDDLMILAIAIIAVAALAWAALPIALVVIACYVVIKIVVFRAHLRRPAIGPEMMVGEVAVALTDLVPQGQVKWKGEIWEAVSGAGVRRGGRVRVVKADSLTLTVEPLRDGTAPASLGPRSRILALLRRA